jgi:hypothetical protein
MAQNDAELRRFAPRRKRHGTVQFAHLTPDQLKIRSQGHVPIVIGLGPADNSRRPDTARRTRKEGVKPESSIEPARPTEKFLGNRNRLLAKPPAALTMKNWAAGA